MNVNIGMKTDPGRRPNNEDQLLVVDVRRHSLRADGVLVIADGMGGRNFGERASAAAVETISNTLTELLHTDRDPSVDVEDALDSALRKANARVYELSSHDAESKGMGTTCVAAVVENDWVYVAHVGDSRAYRLRKGQLTQLTDDHSYVAEQVRAGVITEENAKRSRFRNVITRAVGIEPTILPDVAAFDLQGGDVLLLCTDGLSNMVSEDDICHLLAQAASPQAAADRLVHLANVNGGKDNITAIVARLEVGTKTQKMRAHDLAQIIQPSSENGIEPAAQAAPDAVETTETESTPPESAAEEPLPEPSEAPTEDETPTVQSRMSSLPAVERYAEADTALVSSPRPLQRGLVTAAWILGIVSALLLMVTLTLGNVLSQAGYHFQPAPPFAVKPKPLPARKPADLALATYGLPAPMSTVPVRGDILTRSVSDDSLTVVSLSGEIIRLATDGQTLFKSSLPTRYNSAPTTAVAPASPPTPPAPGLYFATDPQGNLYVSHTASRTIDKFRPNGDYLRSIAAGHLKAPQALAVGVDGTVYVVDAQRLLVIHAALPSAP